MVFSFMVCHPSGPPLEGDAGGFHLLHPIGINLNRERRSYGIMELLHTMNPRSIDSIIPQVRQAMLTTTTETVAATLGAVKRPDRAAFTPSTLVQTLVYGWLANPTASLGQLAHMAARVGVDVSPQAIDRRFTLATATLLHQVRTATLGYAMSAEPVAVPILLHQRPHS